MPEQMGTKPGLVLIPVETSAWHCGHFIVQVSGPSILSGLSKDPQTNEFKGPLQPPSSSRYLERFRENA